MTTYRSKADYTKIIIISNGIEKIIVWLHLVIIIYFFMLFIIPLE